MSEQDFEMAFWGSACENTYGEETKQLKYLELMGFVRTPTWRSQYSFDGLGRSYIDIGGGPCSVLLKFENRGRSVVADPGDYPEWVSQRYSGAGIEHWSATGEELWPLNEEEDPLHYANFDVGIMYNCLQHTNDPERVVRNLRAVAKEIRVFEWIDIPSHPGHPSELKAADLDRWAERTGRVVELYGESECYGRAWILGAS